MALSFALKDGGVALHLTPEKNGLLRRLISRKPTQTLRSLTQHDRALAFALADLRGLSAEHPQSLRIDQDEVWLSHKLVASLDMATAEALGLPPVVDLTLRTDAEGLIGSSSFRLRYEWFKEGQRQLPSRDGSILHTASGPRRLPLWVLSALEVADGLQPGKTDDAQWEALARFRQALDPGVQQMKSDAAAHVSMTDFLSGLEVRLVDRLSISPNADGSDFDIVPFSDSTIQALALDADAGEVTEAESELNGAALATFQNRVRSRGPLAAYRLAAGSYVVVDKSLTPALEAMIEAQRGPADARAAFIRNPRAKIMEAVERALRASGAMDGLQAQEEEELIEKVATPAFIETSEFSARVIGIKRFDRLKADRGESGTTWLPEGFEKELTEKLRSLSDNELAETKQRVSAAIDEAATSVDVAGIQVPAHDATLKVINVHLEERIEASDPEIVKEPRGPIVLAVDENLDDLRWQAGLKPRAPSISLTLPSAIQTPLKAHQVASVSWQQKAWSAGFAGVLNADEQGLGKTLQTIAFLVWLQANMAQSSQDLHGPILVVAPTSLLENWEQEVARHVARQGLGHLIRLYGSAVSARKVTGMKGRDTDDGEAKLDFDSIREAIDERRGHRFWILTTYTTLTNYQHSLGRIKFSAAVFDEIQALKNPFCLRATAARAMNADFRIGLTGTPIENSATDLWAITEQLNAGLLGGLKDFRSRYSSPDPTNMAELHARAFKSEGDLPAFALRRLKDEVARDLPTKVRYLHPRLMPDTQAVAYERARLKLAEGGVAAALKALHHIRSVSVHPGLDAVTNDEEFVLASARLQSTMALLYAIRARNERVLVFIEHRKMQFRFIELACAQLGLAHIDLINGDTPIPKRQAIVNRFQEHLIDDRGFDMLVLGPKAAGTGLTLTAATHVIHLSRWWNPAVEEQCNDRVHRIGQTKPVVVHVPMAVHPLYREQSFDCLLQSLMSGKRKLANSALWPMGDTEGDATTLQQSISGTSSQSIENPLQSAIAAMFERDQLDTPDAGADGSYVFS